MNQDKERQFDVFESGDVKQPTAVEELDALPVPTETPLTQSPSSTATPGGSRKKSVKVAELKEFEKKKYIANALLEEKLVQQRFEEFLSSQIKTDDMKFLSTLNESDAVSFVCVLLFI